MNFKALLLCIGCFAINPINTSAKESVSQTRNIDPKQYSAEYLVTADGKKVGYASRSLSKDGTYWKLEVSSKLKKWFITASFKEYSEFRLLLGEILPKYFYSFSDSTFSSERSVVQQFDWESYSERGSFNKRNWTIKHSAGTLDRISHLFKLRMDLKKLSDKKELNALLSYSVSYQGSVSLYQYKIIGVESIKTPYGKLVAIKVEKVENNNEKTFIWFSEDKDYIPVRILQVKSDHSEIDMKLKRVLFL